MFSPEEAARKVLGDIGWKGNIPVNPEHVAKCYEIDVISDPTLANGTSSGRCISVEGGGRVILVNPADSQVRQRFTIAHELGHALMHDERDHHRTEKKYTLTNYRTEEAQANRFAAELLMPSELVTAAFHAGKGLEELASAFGVSQTAMRIRLETLRLA